MKETERERTRKEKEADDNFRSRGTAAADLCGDENPGKSLSRRLFSYFYIYRSFDTIRWHLTSLVRQDHTFKGLT